MLPAAWKGRKFILKGLFKMSKNVKNETPMQNAIKKIKVAYIMAFISAAITLIFIIISVVGEAVLIGIDAYALIDAAMVIILAVLLLTIKSRVASVILFVHYIASQIIIRIENPGVGGVGSIFMLILFVMAYFNGILGTFSYHKLKKQDGMEGHINIKENADA